MKVNAVIPAHLHLVCRKCTREAGFAGTREEAEALAKREGWIIEESRYWTTAVCPKCPGVREKQHTHGEVTSFCGTRREMMTRPHSLPERTS